MKNSSLDNTLRIAIKELQNHQQFDHYPHWSFIIAKNAIVEWATNSDGVPPVFLGYHQRIHWGAPKMHAELRAWKRARGLISPNTSFECVNIRLNRRGEIRMAAPCSCCSAFLREMGCSKVYFTTDAGWAKSII